MINATSYGNRSTGKEDRLDNTDKSDAIREHKCIRCMACVTVCPPKAVKVEQANLEFHQRASETFQQP